MDSNQHPQKELTVCNFLAYQAYKHLKGIVSKTSLAEQFKNGTFELKKTNM